MFDYRCCVCWAVALAYLTLTAQTVESTPQEDPQHVATALLLPRQKRQFNSPGDFNPFFNGNNFRGPSRRRLPPGAELIFTSSNNINGNENSGGTGPLVYINNRPTIASTPPFVDPITTPEYRECFDRCPATSEYNPICGNDRNLYRNEQKFNCALRCGANIQVLRRGGCEGLFPMMRG